MNQEKLLDYLDHFKSLNNHQDANFGAIISNNINYPVLLDYLKNDYVAIDINNEQYIESIKIYLRMRDNYKNFVFIITNEIEDNIIKDIGKIFARQAKINNLKILFLCNAKNFDNFNLYNLTNSTCRIQ